jgi:predicted metal-dependent hydrolase
MAQKIIELPGIGPVVLAKRRGAKNIRLSIQPNGRVRVGMPTWTPYTAGISFALSRRDWILKNRSTVPKVLLKDGQRIGKSFRLRFILKPEAKKTSARMGINSITVTSNLLIDSELVQSRASKAAEKALKSEAQVLLGDRLGQISSKYGLAYSGLSIKRLTSRWGSCSSQGQITLNLFLVQLPWRLIDYVIVHELAHTKHLDHSHDFWRLVETIIPDAKARRAEIKRYRPVILPN